MPGAKSIYAKDCLNGNFIGVDWFDGIDLTKRLPENWRDFNKEFIPIYLDEHPGKSKVTAGLACGMTWTVAKGIAIGDMVLMPDGLGEYHVGEVTSDYTYQPGQVLPHRRQVNWYPAKIERSAMSQELKNSSGSIGTVCDITKYAHELENLIGGYKPPTLISTDETVEDASIFALESHLEEFLVQNWKNTALGASYDIFSEDGQLVGQQYPTDTGPLDILAISKDKKELLVVELKKGRTSDAVVGQIQRYMGFVKDELAEKNQSVRGIIIALEDDLRIQRALSVAVNIEFYRYKVSFKLVKGK